MIDILINIEWKWSTMKYNFTPISRLHENMRIDFMIRLLTHLVSQDSVIIGSTNGLVINQHQAITWTKIQLKLLF